MAFASVISLMNTIEGLLNSSHISLVTPCAEMIKFAYKELKSLQEILRTLDSSSNMNSNKKMEINGLDGQIREAVSEFEDELESHLYNHTLSLSEAHPMLFSIDLKDLKQDVGSFIETVKKMEEMYINALHSMSEKEGEDEDEEALSLRRNKSSKMVGLSNDLSEIRDMLVVDFDIVTVLFGMAGVGKTAVCEEMFEDPLVLSCFEYRAWVSVGRKYEVNEVLIAILAQVDPNKEQVLVEGDDHGKIAKYLCESLKEKRCLIVLDDLWDTCVWDHLRSCLPNTNNGSVKILVTTRLLQVAEPILLSHLGFLKPLPFLNQNESWDLFCEKVFGQESFPPLLEKAGRKIAENCEGLPLMIVTIANLLSKAEKTPEYWNKVAEKQNSVFMDAYDGMLKVLYPSYHYLPQYLKPCFLYFGVFAQSYEIPLSKLINMWIVEGFLEPDITQTLEDCAMRCLDELLSSNLVIISQLRSTNYESEVTNGIKTCRIHSSFWHLCNREAQSNKFFHVRNRLKDGSGEGIKGLRRLCIHNNILLGIKDMNNSLEDDCASKTIRSLLCFGPYQQYPVSICFDNLSLLKILDALNIRFYEFPFEVIKLVQLRYLALTYDGNLPSSISKLLNLQFLLVHRHSSIRSYEASSDMPIEIWDMKELKHIKVMGSNLPHPNGVASLTNVSKLLGVGSLSCTKEILKHVSNLRKLGIQIELGPEDDSKSLDCLKDIYLLNKLESLKCIIVNPELPVNPPPPLSVLPSSLQKLHLSGVGYPWEYMSLITSLPNLLVLKLRNYAFRGPEWEIEENKLLKLQCLVIEDSDLVEWKVGSGSMGVLRFLILKHCYHLQELQWGGDRFPLEIEMVDCNVPLSVTCLNQIEGKPYVNSHCSWEEKSGPPKGSVQSEWVCREFF